MDLEAVNSKLAEIEAENQAAAAAAEAENETVWDKINNTISDIVSGDAVRQALGETYSNGTDMMPAYTQELPKIEDVAGDVADAASNLNGRYDNFIQQGAALQAAALEGQQSGDYSALNQAVQNVRQAGEDYTNSLVQLAASPVRQNARKFIADNADDKDSPFQSAAQSLQKTDLAITYFTTDAEKAQKAREIEEATGIPAEAILHDKDTYKAALDVYNVKQQYDDMEFAWAAYPEIKNIADMDQEAAVVALHDIATVQETHGVVDTFMHFLQKGSLDLEYSNLQYKIMTGEATDEDKARADDLDRQLKEDRREAPGLFQAPLASMAAGVAQSLPEMGQGLKEGGLASMAATTAAVAFTVATGGTDLLAAGAVMGARAMIMRALASQAVQNVAKTGFAVGMTHGMGKPESGRRYADMGEEKKQDGSPLYTDDERRLYATAGGYANALIETLNVGLGAKALGLYPVAEKVFAQNVEKIVTQAAGRETLRTLAVDKLADFGKLTLTESGEEFLQSVADDLIANAARESKGEEAAHLGTYSAGDILRRGAASFIESLPGSMGFGLAGVSVGAVAGAGRLARARKRAFDIETEAERRQQETYTGAMLVEQLQHAVKDGQMQKVAPDVQAKVLREQLKDTGFENSYIDVEMVLRNENGREDLQKVADAQGMSAEDLEEAISVNGFIPVNTETLCQVDASPKLLEAVSFSPEAESMARMQENARAIAEEYSKNFEKTLERQKDLIDLVVNKYIPGASQEQKEALQGAVLANPQNPAQGWNAVRQEYQEELNAILEPAIKALEAGMGQAKTLDVEDEQGNIKTINTPGENAPWYSEFYSKNKRRPTKEELKDMAIAMVTGDPSAPQVAGWVVDSAETQEAMEETKQTIDTLQQRISELDSIKGEVKKLTGVEMEITEGLTPEGYKVYRAISNWTEKAGGKIARQGRMAAVLTARHADIVAAIIREKTGRPYTAEDYIREKVGFQLVESGKDFDVQLQQMAGERAANAPLAKLEKAKLYEAGNMKPDEIYQKTGWMKGQDGKWRFEIPDNLDNIDFSVFEEGNPDYNDRYLRYVYKNPQLYDAYGIGLVPVRLVEFNGNTGGRVVRDVYGNYAIEINKKDTDEEKKKTLVHEVQHLIQTLEGFAVGGNPAQVRQQIQKRIDALDKAINSIDHGREYAEAQMSFNDLFFSDSMDEAVEEALQKTINELEEIIPEETQSKIYDLAAQKSWLERRLKEETRDDYWLYRDLGGEQEARFTTERAEEWTKIIKEIQNVRKDFEKTKSKYPAEMLDLLKEYEKLDQQQKQAYLHDKTPADDLLATIEELTKSIDPGLLSAYEDYMWTRGALVNMQQELPVPHDDNAIIVFNGKEMPLSVEVNYGGNSVEVDGKMAGGYYSITGDEDIDFEPDDNYSYRFSSSDRGPMSRAGYAMFADDIEEVAYSYGRQAYRVEKEKLLPVEQVQNLVREYLETLKGQEDAGEEADDDVIDIFRNDDGEIDIDIAEGVIAELDPEDIVNSADWYDNEENVAWLWEKILEPNDIAGIKTSNGAIVFDEDLVDEDFNASVYYGRPGDKVKAPNQQTLFQRAWHGSPYDFAYFDLGAIGTGEGAQVHGWGLYFAKDRNISEGYKERLSAMGDALTITDKQGNQLEYSTFLQNRVSWDALQQAMEGDVSKLQESIKLHLEDNIKDKKFYLQMSSLFGNEIKRIEDNPKLSIKAFLAGVPKGEYYRLSAMVDLAKERAKKEGKRTTIKDVEAVLKETKETWDSRAAKKEEDVKKWEKIDVNNIAVKRNTGKLFEVEIPDNDVMLEEKKPFSEQPEKVQKAIKQIVADIEAGKIKSDNNEYKNYPHTYVEYYDGGTGKKLYNALSNITGNRRKASELLNEYGIKGITYEGGQDGRCYVVFDDKAISVINKFNQQNADFVTKGGIAPDPQQAGRKIISLLETADESTFMHEMSHLFLFDLEDLAKIDDTSAKELEIVNQWAEWKPGAAAEYKGTPWEEEFARREQAIIDAEAYGLHDEADRLKYEWKQERFARAFEIYLKDGQAPARGLRAVFRKFKQFLRVIYQAFVGDGGRASEPVRRVMDRMIASEDEIEAAALDDRYSDVLKAGGENLLSESEQETLSRWLDEEKEAAKEKVSKLVMKDLEKEKEAEYERRLAEERERVTHDLQQEDVFVARRALEIGGNKDIVTEWFDSIEAFEAIDKITPSLESLVDAHMKDFAVKLDQQLIDSHLSPEAVAAAMDAANYRQKIETYVLRGMEKKKALINRINTKAQRALDSVEDKLKALPEDVDMKLEKDNPTVKSIMKEINRLRFAGKWTTSDINHIEAMLRASTQEQVRAAIKELKKKQQAKDQQQKDIKDVAKGYEKFIREEVKKVTESQPMTETCNVRYYQDKERQCGKRVQAMLKSGNWDMAVQQQRQKVFYAEMIKQARENREAKDKMVRDLERKARAKSVRLPKDERYWFNHLLYLMRIAKTDIKEPEGGARKLGDLFEQCRNDLDLLYTPDELISIAEAGENYGDYQQMSLRDFKSVYEDLTRLYVIGRDKFKLKTVAGKDIDEVLQEIISEAGTISDDISTVVRKITPDTGGLAYPDAVGRLGSAGDSVAKGVQQYATSILKPENIIKMLGKKAHKYIYGTLEKAAEKEAKLSADNLAALKEICSGMYTHEERQKWDREDIAFGPAKGNKISKEYILCMALNWGTKVNQQRLLGGLIADGRLKNENEQWQVEQEVRALFEKHMTKKDWEFVQRIWDHLDTFWAETTATEEKLNGVGLEKVEASSFSIAADGDVIKLRGGYFPIKYDPEKSARAEEQEVEDAARSMMGAARMGTGRSFTKSRSEYDIYRPLQLNFGVLEQHLQDVIHNIAFRVPLRDVYRLLHYNNFKAGLSLEEYIRRNLGIEAYRNIDQWALDAWTRIDENRNSADSTMKRFSRWLRGSSTLSIMGYRLWPVIENFSNIAIGMDKLGAGKMVSALMDFYAAPQANMRRIRNLSIFMRSRAENLDRDLRKQPGLLHADNKLMEVARSHAYDLMVWSDLMCSAPIWMRSYKDAFEPKLREVKQENDENIHKRLELSGRVDAINGAITDSLGQAEAIDKFLAARRYGTPAEVAALADSPYYGMGEGELRAMWGEAQKQAKALRRDLWEAETNLQKAMELPVWDESEIVEEAERRAALEADGAIRDTFGSGRNIDLPAVMRSRNEFVQLFTAFYGFFNTQYNALYMAYMESKHLPPESHIFKWAPLAKAFMYRVAFTSLIGSSLAFGLGIQGDSKDDKEKTVTKEDGTKEKVEIPAVERFLKLWAKNSISVTTGGLYGIRDLVGIAADAILTGNGRDYGLGSVVTRSISEGFKTVQLLGKKGAKDAEIQAAQDKKQKEHEEKLRKLKGKKRQEYLQKWEEDQKYKKPPQRITYAEILGHAGKGAAALTAAKTGITSTMTNAVTSTMQYMLDDDERFDATLKNILWSALFDKKPVEREIPKKPPAEKKDKKKKK